MLANILCLEARALQNKPFLFIAVYIKNLKASTKKKKKATLLKLLLELISEFGKVSEYKINTQKPIVYIYKQILYQKFKEIKV